MPLLSRLSSLWRNLFRKGRAEEDLREEVGSYLEMLTGEKLKGGFSPEEARRAALIELGGAEQVKERVREVRVGHELETLWQDLRYGGRVLAKNPGFTAVAVLSLALGIGASTAIFSVVNGVLLRPLPYPEPERLVELREVSTKGTLMRVAGANYADVRDRNHSLEALAQYGCMTVNVTGGSLPVSTRTCAVSADFFRTLGVRALAGRTFSTGDSKFGGEAVAVISFGFWQRALGGRADWGNVILNISDRNFAVVGAMPPGFDFAEHAEVWIPSEIFPPDTASRTAHNWSVIARLRRGASLAEARREVSAIARQIKAENGQESEAQGIMSYLLTDMALVPLREFLVGDVRSVLLLLFGAVGFLFLIACANVANLLLVQATAREQELAVRAALGAGRWRLARQFIAESVLLTLAAAVLGVPLASWGVDALLILNQKSLPRVEEIGVDLRVLIFTLGLSLLTATALSLLTALRGSRIDLQTSLKSSGRAQSAHAASSRLRGLFVVSQIALTLVLMIGTGLLVRSLVQLLRVDPGFRTESAVVMDVSYKRPQDEEQRRRLTQFNRQLLDRLALIPGVTTVGGANSLPLTGGEADGAFTVDDEPTASGSAEYRIASEGYFATMGIPLLRGRFFEHGDGPDAPHVALISQSLARKYWPNVDPLGRRIQFGNMRPLNIVGIVGDVRDYGLDHDVRPTVYAYSQQQPQPANFSIVVRSSSSPAALTPAMRAELRALDPELPATFHTLEDILSSSLDSRRFSLIVFGVLAGVALVLAAAGIYGVMAYMVAQRTHEIGIRMALGAGRGEVLRLVLKRGMALALVGVVVGLAGAFAATRLMVSLLYGVTPADKLTFVGVTAFLFAVSLLACYVPARRAAKVDPMVALRSE